MFCSLEMPKQTRIPSNIRCQSFLIGVLYLIRALSLYEDVIRRGRPYVYPTILMVQLYIIKSWMRIPSNNTLHYFLFIKCNNDKLLKVCRLQQIPDRRTIDRRFQVLPISTIINNMGNLFVSERLVDDISASVDSTMLQAVGPVWHKSDIKQNRLPIAGIDTDAKWGYSKSRGWTFGYKLYMSCSAGKLIVPLSACISTANTHDGKPYGTLVDSLAGLFQNILADPAYDDGNLYHCSNEKNLRLICPVKVYPSTPPDRIKLAEFYDSKEGQDLYSQRKVSIEPLFEIVKDIFNIRTLPVKGLENVKSFALVCVLVYQLAVYYNCVAGNENPRIVKRMLCC